MNMSMVQPGFIADVAAKEGITKGAAKRVVHHILDKIAGVLVQGDAFSLPNIGILKVVERAARQSRNPQTGDPISVPAKRTLKIKPAPEIKRRLNEG